MNEKRSYREDPEMPRLRGYKALGKRTCYCGAEFWVTKQYPSRRSCGAPACRHRSIADGNRLRALQKRLDRWRAFVRAAATGGLLSHGVIVQMLEKAYEVGYFAGRERRRADAKGRRRSIQVLAQQQEQALSHDAH